MKIKLTKDHSIRGKVEEADTVVDVHEGVANDLIDRGIATKPSKPAAKKKGK